MAVELKRYQFTVDDFHIMGRIGLFLENDRVELLDGEIVEMPPIGAAYAGCVDRVAALLRSLLEGKVQVRVQNPVRMGYHSELLPDLALLRPRRDYYAAFHPGPEDILLLIEVADATADTDRTTKGPLYARAGVQEYWLVDLAANALEVYRAPSRNGYREVQKLDCDGSVSPMAFPDISIAVKDIVG